MPTRSVLFSKAAEPSRRDVLAASGVMATAVALGAREADAQRAPSVPADATCSPIVEMRQYTLRTGQRDAFVSLFEQEFIESQEAVGIRIIGGFRDLDDPDRYVWLRGFPDMDARAQALGAFYNGDLWKAKRDAANASINHSDNVLLLRPDPAWIGLSDRAPATVAARRQSPACRRRGAGRGALRRRRPDPAVRGLLRNQDAAETRRARRPVVAQFASETSPNNFPRLPIRANDHVFVWFSSFPSEAACDQHLARLRAAQSLARRRLRSHAAPTRAQAGIPAPEGGGALALRA